MSSIRGTRGDYRHYPPCYPDAGIGITIDNTDPIHPVINADDQGGVTEIQAGINISVDSTDPKRPIISSDDQGGITEIQAGSNISVDPTDPKRPIVSLSEQVSEGYFYFGSDVVFDNNDAGIWFQGNHGRLLFTNTRHVVGSSIALVSGAIGILDTGIYSIDMGMAVRIEGGSRTYTTTYLSIGFGGSPNADKTIVDTPFARSLVMKDDPGVCNKCSTITHIDAGTYISPVIPIPALPDGGKYIISGTWYHSGVHVKRLS